MSKPHNHKSKQPDPIRTLYGDPIIIPHDPEHLEETPRPSESSSWPLFLLVGGTIVAVLCIWWFAPELPPSLMAAFPLDRSIASAETLRPSLPPANKRGLFYVGWVSRQPRPHQPRKVGVGIHPFQSTRLLIGCLVGTSASR